jgi:hypothetical protein
MGMDAPAGLARPAAGHSYWEGENAPGICREKRPGVGSAYFWESRSMTMTTVALSPAAKYGTKRGSRKFGGTQFISDIAHLDESRGRLISALMPNSSRPPIHISSPTSVRAAGRAPAAACISSLRRDTRPAKPQIQNTIDQSIRHIRCSP